MPDTPFHWKRFWFPAGSQVSLMDGYLPDSESRMGPDLDARGVELHALAEVPCLILLGIPGMGKTSELVAAADAAKQADELVDFITLARLTGPSELQSELIGSKHHAVWQQGNKVWNIYLDGLDEALAQLSQIEKSIPDLVRKLAGNGSQLNALRLRISCRSAEWPQTLEAELRGIWDSEQVKVYELGHLREKDVRSAVEQLFPSNSQQDQFMSYVQQHDAQPLASRPITLTMLLNVSRQDAALPRRQVELYRKGLLASIEEANETRRANRQTWWLDTRSKLMVAARIAACNVFSNSFEIWTGHQSQVPPERSVILSEIAGGYEPSLDSSFAVGEAELRETLLTSLFAPLRPLLFGWSHQTFAEFLAAYYLLEHGLSAEEALRFFRGHDEATGQIPPQLAEVAAWLASMQPDFFRALVRFDPAILLKSDVAAAEPEDREILVGELLQRIDNEMLHDFQLDFRTRYDRLGHPRLAEQLRPYIFDKSKNRVVRRVAIDIAEANKLNVLATALADVALDATDDIHIRSQAAHAVAACSENETKGKLKRLLRGDQPEDIDDELKGYALRALWPSQLSFNELLSNLIKPKRSNLIGSYYFFLAELQIPPLTDIEALSALEWCTQSLPETPDHTPLEKIASQFLERVFEASGNRNVRERLADFLLGAIRSGTYWSHGDELSRVFLDAVRSRDHAELRRELIRSIIARAVVLNEEEWPLLLGGSNPLLATEDLPWLIELVTSSAFDAVKTQIIQLVVGQTFSQKLDDLLFVWEAADNIPNLRDALARAYTVELSSAVARWQREDFERTKARAAAESQRETIQTIALAEQSLAEIKAGDSFAWWRLNMILFAHLDGRIDPSAEFHSDLTKSRGWLSLPDQSRNNVVSSARRYLEENLVRSRPWLGTNTFHRPAAAGYRAFRLLFSEDHSSYLQLSRAVWRKWATSIFGVSFSDNAADREIRSQIARRCFSQAPELVLMVIRRLITMAQSEFDVRTLLSWFSSASDERLNEALWRHLDQIDSGDFRAKPIIRFLVHEAYAPATQLTIDLFSDPNSELGKQISGAENFVLAAASLIQKDTTAAWPYFCSLRERDEKLAIDVLKATLENVSFGEAPFVRYLSEVQLVDLYVWLFRQIPPPAEREDAGWLGFEDQVEQLRNAILTNLISRGTTEAVSAVQELASKLPEVDWLRWKVVDARREAAASSWKRLAPSDVIAVIASFRPMPAIRSTKEAVKRAIASQEISDITPADELLTALDRAPETLDFSLIKAAAVTPIKPRRIMTVATEWSSGHGGLSTLNRELCIALAAAGHSVVCLVVEPTPREVAEADAAKVRLIGCPPDPAIGGTGRLLLFHPSQLDGYTPEVVLGHDHITGSAAQHIAHRLYGVPNVHFVHTLPDEIEIYKLRSGDSLSSDAIEIYKSRIGDLMLRGAEKADIQYRQCMSAQLVVGVGPRIHSEMSTKIAPNSDVPVVVMRPGLNKKLLEYDVDLARPRRPQCLFLARLEDGELKGAGLACQMICSLNVDWQWPPASRPRLIVRGCDPTPAQFEKEIAAIGGFKEAIQYLIPRPYTADAETVAADIRSASAIIMPSKREGFGLTALEGISAGIPVIVSSESGLAWLLLEPDVQAAIGRTVADACVADVDGRPEDINKAWATRAQAILSDPDKAFSQAQQMRRALIPLLSWENAALKFSNDLELILGVKATDAT